MLCRLVDQAVQPRVMSVYAHSNKYCTFIYMYMYMHLYMYVHVYTHVCMQSDLCAGNFQLFLLVYFLDR